MFANEPRSNAREEFKRDKRRSQHHDTLPNEPVDLVLVDAPCSNRLRREPTYDGVENRTPIHGFLTSRDPSAGVMQTRWNDYLCNHSGSLKTTILDGYDAERFILKGHHEDCDGHGPSLQTRTPMIDLFAPTSRPHHLFQAHNHKIGLILSSKECPAIADILRLFLVLLTTS